MVARNDITGDAIQSRTNSKVFEQNMDRIFGSKEEEKARKQKEKEDYFAKLATETKARMENSSGTKNDYQDILSTEDCLSDNL